MRVATSKVYYLPGLNLYCAAYGNNPELWRAFITVSFQYPPSLRSCKIIKLKLRLKTPYLWLARVPRTMLAYHIFETDDPLARKYSETAT